MEIYILLEESEIELDVNLEFDMEGDEVTDIRVDDNEVTGDLLDKVNAYIDKNFNHVAKEIEDNLKEDLDCALLDMALNEYPSL